MFNMMKKIDIYDITFIEISYKQKKTDGVEFIIVQQFYNLSSIQNISHSSGKCLFLMISDNSVCIYIHIYTNINQ